MVGTQLYGWGQYYDREGKKFTDHLDEVLGLVRDCGFEYAEGSLDSARPEQNIAFARKLKEKGLKPVSLYSGGRFHEKAEGFKQLEKITEACRVAREAGFTQLVCNPDPIGREKTDAELETQILILSLLGQELTTMGMQLGIHHHTPEMVNDAREFHFNFRRTNAHIVGFCYDVHWVYRGGVMPAEALRFYGDRIVSWHLRQSREKIWWEDLAAGDIDYAAIAKTVKDRRLQRKFTVELALEKGTQITRSVVENHKRSREFVKQVFGV